MDAVSTAAIDGLIAVVESLLPDLAEPGVERTMVISPLRVSPVGLGGFVGINREPYGAIQGRGVEAKAVVSLRAPGSEQLDRAAATLTKGVLGTDRAALGAQGILRLALDQVGRPPSILARRKPRAKL